VEGEKISKVKDVILWPEFRAAWILSAVIIAAVIIAANALTGPLAWIETGLLLITLLVVFISIYRVAQTDRDANVEQSELRSILASLDDALIVYDKDFQAIFFNPAAEQMFKISAKNVLGHKLSPQDVEKQGGWRTLIQVIFSSLAPKVVSRSKEGEYPQVVDVSFTDPQLEFRVTTAPVSADSGAPLAFMKIIRDRTAQLAALRSRSEFVTVASHQLRGPVGDINWALQSLSRAAGIGDTDKLILDNALVASQGLLRRIEDLLNIAKMEDGQFGYNFEETDVADFAGKILADVLPAARKANVKIYFDRPAVALPKVMIDVKRLSLALVNVLENAIRYNVENGEVVVKVDKMPDRPFLVVSVKDTGIGIPPEALEKLFSKFYRADNAMKVQTEGSGLGLYIAKSIVSAHGGQIWAESELNRGTSIAFSLPTDPNLVPRREASSEDYL